THPEDEIILLHNPEAENKVGDNSSKLYDLLRHPEPMDHDHVLTQIQSGNSPQAIQKEEEQTYWINVQQLIKDIGLSAGATSLIVNGRVVGPLPSSVEFTEADFELLFSYETSQRLGPLSAALKDLDIETKVEGPLNFAKLTSLVMLSSDPPEGVFEQRSKYRVNVWKRWNSTHSAIDASTNTKDASINIAAAVDPTSEMSQKWLPILKTLSKLAGNFLSRGSIDMFWSLSQNLTRAELWNVRKRRLRVCLKMHY
ncbi:hypothetical protein F66182_15959, partial [Fusarium sp. NRRL 66182]